jgi:hypothetical protein
MRRGFVTTRPIRRSTSTQGDQEPGGELKRGRQQRVDHESDHDGRCAMQLWVTNVIGFALLYWELDRGGPVARRLTRRDELADADWRFSQDENVAKAVGSLGG